MKRERWYIESIKFILVKLYPARFPIMKELIDSGRLGKIYSIRMYYGNGTARLVRDSAWRDQGAGVLPDLGSHLLDTLNFWLGKPIEDFKIFSANRFENRALIRYRLAPMLIL